LEGQAYNTRKNRKGAFWEDRFYTTAIESGGSPVEMHGSLKRESIWTNNLDVGSREYIEQNLEKFGKRYKIKMQPTPPFKVKRYGQVRFRTNSDPNFMDNVTQGEDRLVDYAIHESKNAYNAVLTPEKWVLRGENTGFWSDSVLTTNA
jgi:REP-associated tyrosine transposase